MGINKINVNNESTTIITNDFGSSETLSISQKKLTSELNSGLSYDFDIIYNLYIEDTDVPGKYKLKSTTLQQFVTFRLKQKLKSLEHKLILEFDEELPEDSYLSIWAGRDIPYSWYWLDNTAGINVNDNGIDTPHCKLEINILGKEIEYRSDTLCLWIALHAKDQSNPEKYPLEGYISNIKIYDAVYGPQTSLKNIVEPMILQINENTQKLSEIYPPATLYDKDVHSSFQKIILADSSAFTGYDAETGNVIGVRHASGNTWNSMKRSIVPDFSLPLTIEFDVIDVSPFGSVWISPSVSYVSGVSTAISNYTNGHNKITIDPQYFAAHVSEQYN